MAEINTSEKILNLLQSTNKGLSGSDISRKLKINRMTVSKYLALLKSQNQVSFKERGMSKLWYALSIPNIRPEQDILDFIQRGPNTNHLSFAGESTVVINDMLLLNNIFSNFKTVLDKDEFNKTLIKSAKEFAKQKLRHYVQISGTDFSKITVGDKEKLLEKQVISFINCGWGKIIELSVKHRELNLILQHSTMSKNSGNAPGCTIISGFLAGLMEAAFGDIYNTREVTCISSGEECCEFKARKSNELPPVKLEIMPGRDLTTEEYNKIISNYLKSKKN